MQKIAFVALPHCSIGALSPLLQRFNDGDWKIRTLSFDGKPVITAEGIRIMADASLAETVPLAFDLMVIPGGHYTAEVWDDIRFHRFLRQHDGQRHWFAVAQEGVICLAATGLLGGVMYSLDQASVKLHTDVLAHAIHREDAVTVDANVISSDGSDSEAWAQVVCQRMQLHL